MTEEKYHGNYAYNIPSIIIHIIHLLAGAWLLYIGYNRITNVSISKYHYYILILLGIVVVLNFSFLLSKSERDETYEFEVPKYLVHLTHILNGIVFVLLGLSGINILQNDILKHNFFNIYLIGGGVLAAAYHSHLLLIHH
jgi:hypothetical protein